jgi:hypothetical protein
VRVGLSYDPLRLSPSSAICENTANRAGKYLKRYEPRHPQQSPPNKPNKHPYKTNLQQPPPNKTNPQPTPTNNLQYNLSPNSILYKDIHIELGLNPVYPFNKHPHIFSYTNTPSIWEYISQVSPSWLRRVHLFNLARIPGITPWNRNPYSIFTDFKNTKIHLPDSTFSTR